jgi:Uma2 family endonuclease
VILDSLAHALLPWRHVVRLHRYTYADYVGVEQISDTKHEFYDGEIYAMAGGTEEHAALSAELVWQLGSAVRNRPCRVYTSDLRVYVEATGLATFPDVSVICGPPVLHPPGPESTVVNPLVLVEVTSNSSEDYDLGFKLAAYQTIPSLEDYIVVSHRERRIIVHHREPDGEWTTAAATSGDNIEVRSVAAELDVDEVYRASSIR